MAISNRLWTLLKDWAIDHLDPEVAARIDAIPREHLNQYGVDPFGFDPEIVKLIAPVLMVLYRTYFRAEARGLENLPEGRCLLVSNHSGQLPFDGAMIGAACFLDAPKPRVLRSLVEFWSAELPFVSTFFNRAGQVVGTPAVARRLLEMDEALMVFPEGVRGLNKPFSERYKLQGFGNGFMRLAMSTGTPIVPVAVVGAEEQAPAVADIKPVAKMLGLPALPLVLPQILPLPLPVKYHIAMGAPMTFEGDGNEDDDFIAGHVRDVHRTIQHMLDEGRARRTSIF